MAGTSSAENGDCSTDSPVPARPECSADRGAPNGSGNRSVRPSGTGERALHSRTPSVPPSGNGDSLPWTTIPSAEAIPGNHAFVLCLTHDVDRPYKTFQAPYYAITDRDPTHLRSLVPGVNPYWSFERIRRLESDLEVRSSFNFMDEQWLFTDRPVAEWIDPNRWALFTGRYAIDDPRIVREIRSLDANGWEVGLHGSYLSYDDRERLGREKARLEAILGRPVRGGRQHHLNLSVPETWTNQAAVGLGYDSTLGSSCSWGFDHGYELIRPFDDAFVEFPLTLMDVALERNHERARERWRTCERLLEEAATNGAVMTVLFHPRFLGEDHPEYVTLYRRLIERALDLGAWVGPPGELYARLDHPVEPPLERRS